MVKAVLKMLFIAVMLVAFVGQATAFNTFISCETSADPLFSNVKELVKHSDSKTIDTSNSEDCCDIDCCDEGCCIANTCSSFSYINTQAVDSLKTGTEIEAAYIQLFEQPQSISSLFYRPPIFPYMH